MVIRSGRTPAYCDVRLVSGMGCPRKARAGQAVPGGLGRHRDIAHQLAELLGQPVQRGDDHVFETAGFDLDHQSIVQRSGAAAVSPGGIASHLIVPSTGRPLARCPPKAGPFPGPQSSHDAARRVSAEPENTRGEALEYHRAG